MTLEQFEEQIKDKSLSDEYIANMLSQLIAKHVKWKWDNRRKRKPANPYYYLDGPLGANLMIMHRPKVYKAISKMAP